MNKFKVGDEVTVKVGKYIGCKGVVIRIVPISNHLVVRLNINNTNTLTYKEDSLETVSSTHILKVGDRITVKSGKYAGFDGVILRQRSDNWYLVNLDKIIEPPLTYPISSLELNDTIENEPGHSNKDNLKDLIVKEYADKQVWCIIDNSGGLEAGALTLDQVKKLIVDEYDESYHIEVMIPMFDLKAETSYSFIPKD